MSNRQYSVRKFARGLRIVYNHEGMPFHRPLPNSDSRSKLSSGVSAIVEAEKLLQLALMLPCAAVIGWLIGAWADKHFHQGWIAIAGVVFGSISGLVYVIQMALKAERTTRNGNEGKDGSDSGSSNGGK
jgi:ATP synthase protein I